LGANEKLYWYLYRIRGTDQYVEVGMTILDRNEREQNGFLVLPDGTEAKRAVQEEILLERGCQKTKRRRNATAKWPMESEAAGVHPSQVEEVRSFIKDRGLIGTTVKDNGNIVWDGKRARKEYCESAGLYDRNAGYSDPQPNNL
jgi:hypothetical protein